MLLKQNLSLYRILKITWQIDLLMIASCTAAYFLDTLVLKNWHLPATFPALMGTAIAFFIGFSNNEAYSRWWEARTIWGGLVNDSRSWARALMAYSHPADYKGISQQEEKMIKRHLAFLYALKASLRRKPDGLYEKYLSEEERNQVKGFTNIPNAILDIQARELQLLQDMKYIDGFKFLHLNGVLTNFTDGMGKSERINNTVFPTTYVYFTRLFIWMLVILVTMALSSEVGPSSIFLGWIIGFVFHTTHINGMSLMNPFEFIPSGVPLDSITRTIEINLLEGLGEKFVPAPIAPERGGEYIL
jgi:ion channel-forming bestrophin family protein